MCPSVPHNISVIGAIGEGKQTLWVSWLVKCCQMKGRLEWSKIWSRLLTSTLLCWRPICSWCSPYSLWWAIQKAEARINDPFIWKWLKTERCWIHGRSGRTVVLFLRAHFYVPWIKWWSSVPSVSCTWHGYRCNLLSGWAKKPRYFYKLLLESSDVYGRAD